MVLLFCIAIMCYLLGGIVFAEEPEQSHHVVTKDNILTFSRQNTKLCAAEADFERLLRNKEETKELFGYKSNLHPIFR